MDLASLIASSVFLEMDVSYTIGKSFAVLIDQTIIWHLDRQATRVVWRFLRSGSKVDGKIYKNIGNWKNAALYSLMTHSFEIGVRINFCSLTRDDGKFLMAHISKRKLSSFPGVTPNTVPEDLRFYNQSKMKMVCHLFCFAFPSSSVMQIFFHFT